MHPNLEMDSWRILSGGRLLEWEFAIMQETNLLRRGAWVRTGYNPCPDRSSRTNLDPISSKQEFQRTTFVEACPDSTLVCLDTRGIELRNHSGIRTGQEGTGTPPPKNSGFLFKDLLWASDVMGKMWEHWDVFSKFCIEEFESWIV